MAIALKAPTLATVEPRGSATVYSHHFRFMVMSWIILAMAISQSPAIFTNIYLSNLT